MRTVRMRSLSTLERVAGSTITIDLGRGQFAYYMHLQPGKSARQAAERVRRRQARVGYSGNARESHLHFEATDSSKMLAREGLPCLVDQYRSMSASGGSGILRIRELPLNNNLVAFAGDLDK